MTLTRLTPDAAAEYRALMLRAYTDAPTAFTSTTAEREALPLSWWESRLQDTVVIGAFDADRLVGVAGLRPERRERTSHKATLFGMFVVPSCRGRGLGRDLVDAVLDHAHSSPSLRVVQLTVTDSNGPAVRLYEACGFVRFGSEPYAVQTADGFVTKAHMWCDVFDGTA